MRAAIPLALLMLASLAAAGQPPPAGFVYAAGGLFKLDGGVFKVAGCDQYSLMSSAAQGRNGLALLGEVLDKAAELGLNVIRTWSGPPLLFLANLQNFF